MKYLVHLGSWKASSTLLQTNLRQNRAKLHENGVFFADQRMPEHSTDFAQNYRQFIKLLSQKGSTHPDTVKSGQASAEGFKSLCYNGCDKIIHSWEPFLGHPFKSGDNSLYHAHLTAYWFQEYLNDLDINFLIITRNQADLAEAMYNQEVRKGRFLGDMDTFLADYVDGKDLSWLSVVEPFFSRFDMTKIKVMPFEFIKESADSFIDAVFDDFLGWKLNKKTQHANPSFSAKAIEIALETYPGMTKEERLAEERRLVRDYSNLDYPRAKFLSDLKRAEIMHAVGPGNASMFNRYMRPYKKYTTAYLAQGESPRKGISTSDRQFRYSRKKALETGQSGNLRLISPSGKIKDFPIVSHDSGVTVTAIDFRIPFPSHVPFLAKFEGSTDCKLQETLAGEVIKETALSPGESFKTSASYPRSLYRVVGPLKEADNPSLDLEIKMDPVQALPTEIAAHEGRLLYKSDTWRDPGLSADDATLPIMSNALISISDKPQTSLTAPERPNETTLFYLTIDTESLFFQDPSLMTGQGLEGAIAAYDILDTLDKHGLKAIFFVNIYEAGQYQSNAVERLCKDIHERGHEIGLHSHASPSLPFYEKEINHYDYTGQLRIIEHGLETLNSWTGQRPTTYRAGGYVHTEDTLKVLQDLDFAVDSSYLYGRSNIKSHKGKLCHPYRIGNLIEVPVTYIPEILPNGLFRPRKYDFNWISPEQCQDVLKQATLSKMPVLSFMMHSFSFIKKSRFNITDTGDFLLRSIPSADANKFIGVTKLLPELFDEFNIFLETLKKTNGIKVTTFRDSLAELSEIADAEKIIDQTPILYK